MCKSFFYRQDAKSAKKGKINKNRKLLLHIWQLFLLGALGVLAVKGFNS